MVFFFNGTLSTAACKGVVCQKSISPFEIYNSDSGVKQAKACSFYKAEATRSLVRLH